MTFKNVASAKPQTHRLTDCPEVASVVCASRGWLHARLVPFLTMLIRRSLRQITDMLSRVKCLTWMLVVCLYRLRHILE